MMDFHDQKQHVRSWIIERLQTEASFVLADLEVNLVRSGIDDEAFVAAVRELAGQGVINLREHHLLFMQSVVSERHA